MTWLRNETDDLYDPGYTDMLRVSFGTEFKRAKLEDLVSLLSGRNFATRSYESEIITQSFEKLKAGIFKFMNETNFKRFVMIIKSAGFKKPWMVRSQNAINFAYLLYISLKDKNYDAALIESYVKRWFVMSMLTGRSSGSFESQFDFDIKQLETRDFGEYLERVEAAELSDAFWEVTLPQAMITSVASSPYWCVYLASQIVTGDKGFLSTSITVENMVEHRGDIHHIFPKDYLKKQGLTRGQYNQIANYTYMQSEINIKVGNKPPSVYMGSVLDKVHAGDKSVTGFSSTQDIESNLKENAIPSYFMTSDGKDYDTFLEDRRALMTEKIKKYYKSF